VKESKDKLESSVGEFLRLADADERQRFEDTRMQLQVIIDQAHKEHNNRYSEKAAAEHSLMGSIKSRCKAALETAYEYSQMMDVLFSQAPEYAALAWAVIKLLLAMQANYEELKANIYTHLEHIKTRFHIIDHLTAYIPAANLVELVAKVYNLFYRFLTKAIKLYTGSRFSKLYPCVWKCLITEKLSRDLSQSTYREIKIAVDS
jgi:hypothetical protein